jgi:hypothetical protein
MIPTSRQAGFGRALKGTATAVAVALAILTIPRPVAAEAAVTTVPFTINFNSLCAGEVIRISGTLHLVDRPGGLPADHANWSGATGVGLTTGTSYNVASASNLFEDPNLYLVHFTVASPGPGGITSALTAIGPLGGAPVEVIEQECH